MSTDTVGEHTDDIYMYKGTCYVTFFGKGKLHIYNQKCTAKNSKHLMQ